MRSLAQHLGVKPMALYYHVANKGAILDGIVDLVFSEIELPSSDDDWRTEMERRARSARLVLHRHPWAIDLLQSPNRSWPGDAATPRRDHRRPCGAAGFSVAMTAHAYALLDSYIYGFALSEARCRSTAPRSVAEVAGSMMQEYDTEAYPLCSSFDGAHP